jgi:hypothetical protein
VSSGQKWLASKAAEMGYGCRLRIAVYEKAYEHKLAIFGESSIGLSISFEKSSIAGRGFAGTLALIGAILYYNRYRQRQEVEKAKVKELVSTAFAQLRLQVSDTSRRKPDWPATDISRGFRSTSTIPILL